MLRSVSRLNTLLFVLVALFAVGPTRASAANLTISGAVNFTALDGGPDDEDHELDGVFTVSGDLTVNGTITCNDQSGNDSGCPIAFNVGHDLLINAGGAVYAENRTGAGSGAPIAFVVGHDIVLRGPTTTFAGAIVSTDSMSSSRSTGGYITIGAGNAVTIEPGATVDAGSANATSGDITITAGGHIVIGGNVLAGPSRTILSTRLTDAALAGGTGNQVGGAIIVKSISLVQPAVSVGANANIISQGQVTSAGPVMLEGCGIVVNGLVASLSSKDASSRVVLRSGKTIVIDGRDLGVASAALGRNGRIRADAVSGTAENHALDLFAAGDIAVFGPDPFSSSLFAISATPGAGTAKTAGAHIRMMAVTGGVTASGNAVIDGRTDPGNAGGDIAVEAQGDINLQRAVLVTVGDSSTNSSGRRGGAIAVRSYSGKVVWTNGTGDVRPSGSSSGLTAAEQGSISITACGTIDLNGSTFPTIGAPAGVFPTTANACSPAASSLPAREPALPVCCNAITIANPSVTTGGAGEPFVQKFMESGAIGTPAFSMASGALPAGLTLSADGTVSGTALVVGTFPITVQVTDSAGCTGSGSVWNLQTLCETINVANPEVTTALVASPFFAAFTQKGAIGPAVFSTTSVLPGGLTLSKEGVLSGTPAQTGTYSIVVTAMDGNGCAASTAYRLTIACQTVAVANPAASSGTIGTPVTLQFTASNTIGTTTFATASLLPAGLALASNGTLSGTPAQTGTFPIAVMATDANGCRGTSAMYNLAIACQRIAVTNPPASGAVAGAPFTATFTQSGAIGTATFSTASALSAGITLSGAGVLAGSPVKTGTFPVVVTATDSNGCSGSGVAYNLTVACQNITVTNPSASTGTVGSAFTQQFTAADTIGATTFSTTSPLPSGLTLAAEGTLSGTPLQTGSFPIVVKATDTNGCSGSGPAYTFVLSCQTITVTNPTTNSAASGSSFTAAFTAAGASGTVMWSERGTLPSGVRLDVSTGVLSGTPNQTGIFPITVTAADANGCAGSSDYTLTVTSPVPAPVVFGISPTQGPLTGGNFITIFGANFVPGQTTATVGGITPSDAFVATTGMAVRAPAGAAPGTVSISVTTPGGTATLPNAYTYLPPPAITGFSPTIGRYGTTVTIQGTQFEAIPERNFVAFNGTQATVVSGTATQIVTAVPMGATAGPITVATLGGSAQSSTPFNVITYTALQLSPSPLAMSVSGQAQLTDTATLSDGSTLDVTSQTTWTSSNTAVARVDSFARVAALLPGAATITGSLSGLTATAQVTVAELPADPVAVAPKIDPTVPTDFIDSIAFLYSGANPVQRDVAFGALVAKRVCELHGRVLDGHGIPLSGVRISIHDDPNVGYTLSRADGMYDIVTNGGDMVAVAFEKPGYIPVHRRFKTPWHDFVAADDVSMMPYDAAATTVNFNPTTQMSVARGTTTVDSDGTRRATLLFQAGTGATMQLANGTSQTLTAGTVRATEETIGKVGNMPADLPKETAYTYCVELTVDEAVNAGATTVTFTKPVGLYLENFLRMAVGTIVPVGYYDRGKAEWIASDNGRVLKILSTTGGVATVDIDGDGVADDGMSLGIADDERRTLATLYTAGQTLWRVPVSHFSAHDSNFGFNVPSVDGGYPSVPRAKSTSPLDSQSCQAGSIIECESLSIGKSIPVAGTPYTLEYRSHDTPGYATQRSLDITLSTDTVPSTALDIQLTVEVAGRKYTSSFAPAANLKTTFTWDPIDVFNRPMYTDKSVKIDVGYTYKAYYTARTGSTAVRAWADISSGAVTPNETRQEATLHQTYSVPLRGPRPDQGLGGWTLSPIQSYDLGAKLLRLGTGNDVSMEARGAEAAKDSPVYPSGVATAADGNIYAAQFTQPVVKITTDGFAQTVAGGGSGPTTDGSPAIGAALRIRSLDVGPNGDLYLMDDRLLKIFRVHNNVLTTVATTTNVGSMTVGRDGAVYFINYRNGSADTGGNGDIYRVDSSGNVTPFAMTADTGISYALIKSAPNGSIYVQGDRQGYRNALWRWDGSWTRVAFPNNLDVSLDDGWAVDDVGRVYLAYRRNGLGNRSIAVMEPDGTHHDYEMDVPPYSAAVEGILPDGRLVYSDYSPQQCGGVTGACMFLGGTPIGFGNPDGYLVVHPNGTEAYQFASNGRHLWTKDPLTAVQTLTLGYDSHGLPSTLTDENGQVTNIQRAGDGTPTALVAPNGERTTLQVGANGSLASITTGGQTHGFSYTSGLLTSYVDPNGNTFSYSFDGKGRLQHAAYPGGGAKDFSFNGGDAETTQNTTVLGRRWQFDMLRSDPAANTRTITNPAGLSTRVVTNANSVTTLLPDGTLSRIDYTPDPRWGAMAPLPMFSLKTPSGLAFRAIKSRSVQWAGVAPFGIGSLTDRVDINGNVWTSTYTSADIRLRTSSPFGRTVDRFFDARGHLAGITSIGLTPTAVGYDEQGRIASTTQGERRITFGWNGRNQLSSYTDSVGHTVSYSYDEAGRIASKMLPGGGTVQFTYDANGDVLSISPPSRPASTFSYNPVDLQASVGATQYSYNADRQLTSVALPSGDAITFSYDAPGRLTSMTTDRGPYTYSYEAAGALRSITAPGGDVLSYSHDGPLLTGQSWTGSVTGNIEFQYDSDFHVISESIGDVTTNFTYDSDGLLVQAGDLQVVRDARTGLVNSRKAASITQTFGYNGFGEITSAVASYYDTPLLSRSYTRDGGGRISQIAETFYGETRQSTYAYDAAGRLSDVTVGGTLTAHYSYDGNGNRLTRTTPAGTTTAAYDDADRLITYDDAIFTYSATGRLATRTDSRGTTTFGYDALGNLRKLTLPDGTVIDYLIDGQNRRVGKKINGVFARGWLYDAQFRVVAELDTSGVVIRRFIYGDRGHVPESVVIGTHTYLFISDHLGSPRLVIDSVSGAVVQRLEYDEFGDVLVDSHPGFQPLGFAGGLYDPDTKLVRFGVRDYDPQTGRWTAKDPISYGGGQTNLYAYTFGDPVNWSDSNGMYAGVDDAIFAAGGALVGIGGQIFGDVLSGHVSGWQDYTAAAVGGAVGGWALEYIGPVGAGAAGAFAANLTRQGLNLATGEQCAFSYTSLVEESSIGALTGKLFGSVAKQGITAGRNSYNGIYRQMVTKLENGTISRVAPSTAAKMFVGRATDTGFFTGTAGGAAIGIGLSEVAPPPDCGCR